MKKFFDKKIYKLIAVFLAVLIISVIFGGCDIVDVVMNTQTDETSQSSAATNTVITENVTGDTLYGFDSIGDESVRAFYGLIGEYACKETEEVFTVEGELSYRQLYEGICAYKEDHPEAFWLKNNCKVYYDGGNTCVSLVYIMDYEARVSAQKELDEKIDEIISNAPSDATQFELELYAHDYITDNCEYDYESAKLKEENDNTGNAYGALVEGKAVCEGYSRAFQLICKELGIECVNIFGTSEGENHMWSCAKIDGEWYHIDVTWDDTESEQKEISGYLYFNLDDESICKDHQISELYENVSDEEFESITSNLNLYVPECTATEYNYHLYYGCLITDIEDSDDIVSAIAQAAKEERDMFYLTVDDSLDFEDTSSKLIEGGYIAEWIGSANLKNFYSPKLNVQTEVYTLNKYNLLVLVLQYT